MWYSFLIWKLMYTCVQYIKYFLLIAKGTYMPYRIQIKLQPPRKEAETTGWPKKGGKNTVGISCLTPKFRLKCSFSFLSTCQLLLLTSSHFLCGEMKGSVHSHFLPNQLWGQHVRNAGKFLSFLRNSHKYELTSSLMQQENWIRFL